MESFGHILSRWTFLSHWHLLGGACAGEKWTPLTLNTPFLVAVALGAAAGVGFLLLFIICMCGRTAHPWDGPLKGSLFKRYRLRDIQAMTGDFSDACVVGRGALWTAYCGRTKDGTPCAVKVHRQMTQYAYEKEVMAAPRLRHRNLVRLLGYCVEKGNHILVHEYDPYKSLQERLHGAEQTYAVLTIQRRLSAALGVSQALQHLHSNGCFHVDVIPTNVWIDREGTAKVADLGFMKEAERLTAGPRQRNAAKASSLLVPPDPVLDIEGYVDPEYGAQHRHGWRVDVYRLGVLLLELLSGRRPLVGAEDQAAALHHLRGGSHPNYPPPLDSLSRVLPKGAGTAPANAGVGPNRKQHIQGPAMHIRVWASALLSAGDLDTLLDPRIAQAEAVSALPRPGSTEAELRRQVLHAYLSLALRCTGPAEQRPLPRFIISELAGLCRLWRASSMVLLAHPGESQPTSVAPSDTWDSNSMHSGTDPLRGPMVLLAHPGESQPASVAPSDAWASVQSRRDTSYGAMSSTLEGQVRGGRSTGYPPMRYAKQDGEDASGVHQERLWDRNAGSSRNDDSSFLTAVSSAAPAVSHSCSLARSTVPLEAECGTEVPRRRKIPPKTVKAIVRELIQSGVRAGAASSSDADSTFSLQPSTLASHCSSLTRTGLSQGTMYTRPTAGMSSCTTLNTQPATALSSCATINRCRAGGLSGCTTIDTRAATGLSSCTTMSGTDGSMPVGSISAFSLSTGSGLIGGATDEESTKSPPTAPHMMRATVRRVVG